MTGQAKLISLNDHASRGAIDKMAQIPDAIYYVGAALLLLLTLLLGMAVLAKVDPAGPTTLESLFRLP